VAVTAYADFLRFGFLPFAGGCLDQPGELMEDFRLVHAAYSKERERLDKQEERKLERRAKRGRR
jgi:hypothetical protein